MGEHLTDVLLAPKTVYLKGQFILLPTPNQVFFLTFPCPVNSPSCLPDVRLDLSYIQHPLFPGHPRLFAKPSSYPPCSAPPNYLFSISPATMLVCRLCYHFNRVTAIVSKLVFYN